MTPPQIPFNYLFFSPSFPPIFSLLLYRIIIIIIIIIPSSSPGYNFIQRKANAGLRFAYKKAPNSVGEPVTRGRATKRRQVGQHNKYYHPRIKGPRAIKVSSGGRFSPQNFPINSFLYPPPLLLILCRLFQKHPSLGNTETNSQFSSLCIVVFYTARRHNNRPAFFCTRSWKGCGRGGILLSGSCAEVGIIIIINSLSWKFL